MLFSTSALVSAAGLALLLLPSVSAHALVENPTIRTSGDLHLQQCGQKSHDVIIADPTSEVQEQMPVNDDCNIMLCRGALWEDQPEDQYKTVTAGEHLTWDLSCNIKHGGPANISLVDTTKGGAHGSVIGTPLKSFDDFCPTTPGIPPINQTTLQFQLPSAEEIGGRCSKPGECVVQLFWQTPDFSQQFIYCSDVKVTADAGEGDDDNEGGDQGQEGGEGKEGSKGEKGTNGKKESDAPSSTKSPKSSKSTSTAEETRTRAAMATPSIVTITTSTIQTVSVTEGASNSEATAAQSNLKSSSARRRAKILFF